MRIAINACYVNYICISVVLLLLFLRITHTVCFSTRRKMENKLCNLHETINIIEDDIENIR